jgi:hypothetical protein
LGTPKRRTPITSAEAPAHAAPDLSALAQEKDKARFLSIGRILTQFCAEIYHYRGRMDALDSALRGTGISRRRALYWMEIDRIYSRLSLSPERLSRIGWTKLSILARYVDQYNIEGWLDFAEANSVIALRSELRGLEVAERALVLKLRADDYDLVMRVLLSNGARIRGSTQVEMKEEALLKICRGALRAKKDVDKTRAGHS